MTRLIAFLLLVIASSSRGDPIQSAGAAVAAHSSSFVRTPPIWIDASTPIIIATTNATTTASPTKALAPSPAPAPTITPTRAPSKKYVSPDGDDDGDDESEAEKIEREIPKIATVFLWVSISFASIWLVCYFRDAILFFFGNVRRRPNRAFSLLYFPHIIYDCSLVDCSLFRTPSRFPRLGIHAGMDQHPSTRLQGVPPILLPVRAEGIAVGRGGVG